MQDTNVGGSGSGKTNALLNLINHQLDIDKIYLYAKDPYAKYHRLINKHQSVGRRVSLNTQMTRKMSTRVLKSIIQIGKVLIVFDDMIVVVTSNRKLHSVVTELFIRGPKLNISLVYSHTKRSLYEKM